MFARCMLLLSICLPLTVSAQSPEPYTPESDDTIVATLPIWRDLNAQKRLEMLQLVHSKAPSNLQIAAQLAERYLDMADETGDPRYYGRAQAALRMWWEQDNPPLVVLRLRADIWQFSHHFEPAIADLNKVLEQDPNDSQSWFNLAVIQMVRAQFDAAKKACVGLESSSSSVIGEICQNAVKALTGQVREAVTALSRIVQNDTDLPASLRQWARVTLAETLERMGEHEIARNYFREALSEDPNDGYLLAAYSDFLLHQNLADEVLPLLVAHKANDNLLLRYGIAAARLQTNDAKEVADLLESQFQQARDRNTPLHQREEAMFWLKVRRNAPRALEVARENFVAQREPIDALIYFEAAQAANHPGAIQFITDWYEETKLEDKRKGGS